jgi:integrase/recombinase XerD
MDTWKTESLDKIHYSAIWDDRRPKNNGQCPVKYRITYLRDRMYYPSGIDLTRDEWEALPKARKPSLVESRKLIDIGFDKIKKHIKELVETGSFSFEDLNKRLSRGMKNSVLTALFDKAESLKEAGRIGTSEWYFYSAKAIGKYLTLQSDEESIITKDLKFSQVTISWLQDFEAYMLDNGKSFTTISMHLRALQAIVNDAKKEGIVTVSMYPFGKGKYEIPEGTGRKLALSLSQIYKVMQYPLISEVDLRCRDLWYFSYLANGANFGDLLKLRYKDIIENELRFFRQKTIRRERVKKEIVASLLPEMLEIIQRWGNPDRKPENLIFHFLANENLTPEAQSRIKKNVIRLTNKVMNRIGVALGYGPISTYSARHSFASVLKRSGANIAYISESLGHSDVRTTENYLASFESETRRKYSLELINFQVDNQSNHHDNNATNNKHGND